MSVEKCTSIGQVRAHIDAIDREIVQLIATRGEYVKQAAQFKSDAAAVRASKRVERVIERVREMAEELGADPLLVEEVYRTMIHGFIEQELSHHRTLRDRY